MTLPSRYQAGELIAEHGPVRTYRGLDPVTGLPVLIYRFPGRPRADAGSLKSDRIPSILAVSAEAEESVLVAAYGRDHQRLDVPTSDDLAPLLLHSARALFDAASSQVSHGDIRPERFYKSRHGYLIEGYGVPWDVRQATYRAPETDTRATLAADIYAWGASIRRLGGDRLPETARKVVAACLREDPADRPNAKQLYRTLRRHLSATHASNAQTSNPDTDNPDTDAKTRATETAAKPERKPDKGERSADDFDFDFGLGGSSPAAPSDAKPSPSKRASNEQSDTSTEPGAFSFDLGSAEPGSSKPSSAEPSTRSSAPNDSEDDAMLIHTDPGTRPADSPEGSSPERPSTPSAPRQSPAPVRSEHKSPERKPPERKPPETAPSPSESSGFVKDLPPGATYRAGQEADETKKRAAPTQRPLGSPSPPIPPDPERGRYLRRVALVVVLLVGGAALATFAFLRQDDTSEALTPDGSTRYIVDVDVLPDSLRLVTVSVVSSPTGSERRPGDEIATVPGPVVLDEAGQWQLRARFQERVSEVRTVTVPAQQTITFDLSVGEDAE
ncbi:MAG: hypothetical protein U5L04_14680 [Trueperaceae bacterium]|nr:hypothetical protein [Trueperaceae bacterium]